MTAILWAAVTALLGTLGVCLWQMARQERAWRQVDEAVGRQDYLITRQDRLLRDKDFALEEARLAYADLGERHLRVTAERDVAQDRAGKAVLPLLNTITRERSIHVQRLTDERLEHAAALMAICRTVISAPRALPPGRPAMPKVLPRGAGFLVKDKDGPLILPVDDEDAGFSYWAAEPLPAGSNGTGGQ